MWVADAVLLAATFVWGVTFVVVRDALREMPPLHFVAWRFTLAAMPMLPLGVLQGAWRDRECWRAGGWVGLWLFLGFAFQTIGLRTVSPARAAFLTGLCVVMVPLLLLALHRRPPAAGSLLGAALATAGLALLTGAGDARFAPGDGWVLAGAFAFACQIVAVGRFAAGVGPLRMLGPEIVVVAALAWATAWCFEEPAGRIGPRTVQALAITALLASVGALWGQNWAQQRTPPARAAVILTMEPVFAAAYAYVAVGERFGPAGLAGCTLIVVGMLAAELLPGRREPVAGVS